MIARQSLLMIGTRFFVRLLGWIGLVVLAKSWGSFAPEATGVIGFAMAFLGIFSIISRLGINEAHVKKISEGQDLGLCLGTFGFLKLVLSLLMVVFALAFIYVWKTFFGGGFVDATTETVVYVFILYYVILNFQYIPLYTFQATREIAKRQFCQLFEGLTKAPLEIVLAVAGVSIAGVAVAPMISWPDFLEPFRRFISQHPQGSLAMAYVFAALTPLLVGFFLLRKYPLKKPTKDMIKSYIVFALPLSLISVIGIVSTNIDKIMIGYFWTSSEVGYYFTIQQILEMFQIVYASVAMAMLPSFSKHHSNKNMSEIRRIATNGERYLSMVMIPAIVVVIVYARPIISIMLTNAYLPAASALMILSVMTYFRAQNNYLRALIIGVNRQKLLIKTTFVTLASNIIINLILIPESNPLSIYGINGAAGASVATLISMFLCCVYMRYYVRKLTGVAMVSKGFILHAFAGVIMGVFLYYCLDFTQLSSWYGIGLFSLVGLGIYILILKLLREFDKDDLNFFLDIINFKQMIKYIKEEITKKK